MPAPPRSRIVVAVDPDAPSDLPLDMAQQLWSDAATELIGLFVEDARLFEHAGSRLAREVVFSGGERSLDAAALARQLRARAAEARRRFETHATDLGLRHAFQILRGDLVGELVREAAGAEALVVGVAAGAAASRAWWSVALERLAQAPLPAVLFPREGWLTGRGIVAVLERQDAATALEAALRFARRSRSPLTLLLTAAAASERETLAAAATELAAGAGVSLHAILSAAEPTLATILRVAQGARLLVLPQHETPADSTFMTTLVAQMRVPLLVVGARERT
jgi:hypothetical protein